MSYHVGVCWGSKNLIALGPTSWVGKRGWPSTHPIPTYVKLSKGKR